MTTTTTTTTTTRTKARMVPRLDEAGTARFREKLDRLTGRGHALDWQWIALLREIRAIVGLRLGWVLQRQLDVAPGTTRRLVNMVSAADVVEAEDVWRAVGWAGVRRLVDLDPKDRADVEREILKMRDRRGLVSDAAFDRLMAPHEATAQPEDEDGGAPTRSRYAELVRRTIAQFRHVLEEYDLPGYVIPPDVAAFVKAKIKATADAE